MVQQIKRQAIWQSRSDRRLEIQECILICCWENLRNMKFPGHWKPNLSRYFGVSHCGVNKDSSPKASRAWAIELAKLAVVSSWSSQHWVWFRCHILGMRLSGANCFGNFTLEPLKTAEHRYGHWRMWPKALKHQHLAPAGDESSWKVPSYLLQKILWILCWFYGSYGTMPGGMSQIHLFTHLPGPGNAIPHGLRHQKVEDELGRMVAQRDLKFDTATLTWSWVTCGSDWGWKIHI